MSDQSHDDFEWSEPRLAALRGVAEAAGAAILGVYARLEAAHAGAAAAAGGGAATSAAGGAAARAAASAAAGAAVQLQRKADDSPLTEADLLADRLIRARLGIMFKGCAVLSEEGHPKDDVFDPAPGYFLVDPLDGTKEFLARNGEFTVNIAWVRGARVLAAVVHAPALGETFWGAAGVGAWKATTAAPGVSQPIRVAPLPGPEAVLRVLASRSHGGAVQRAYLSRLPHHTCIEAGSSLKFCRLAEGAGDLYPRLTATMAWDTAAGQGVLEAAGGVVFGTEGAPLRVPGRPREAPNPPFFAASSAELARRAVAVL